MRNEKSAGQRFPSNKGEDVEEMTQDVNDTACRRIYTADAEELILIRERRIAEIIQC